MSSREKRASLSSGLLIPKDIASAADAEPVPDDGLDADGDDHPDDDRPDEAADLTMPAALTSAMLSRKGAASAAGFRPEYWSYDRAVAPPPVEPNAVVPLFSDASPLAAAPPAEIAATPETPAAPEIADTSETAVPAPVTAPAAKQTRPSVLILGLGCIAIIISVSLYWLSQAGRDRAAAPPSAPIIAVQPVEPTAAPLALTKDVAAAPETSPASAATPDAAPQHLEAQHGDVRAPDVAAPQDAPAVSLPPDEVESLIARGDQLLETGDIAAARLFFQRAAEQGSGAAATEVGKTFDPLFLEQIHARGIRGDAATAATWYRKAAAAGDHQGQNRLDRLLARFPG